MDANGCWLRVTTLAPPEYAGQQQQQQLHSQTHHHSQQRLWAADAQLRQAPSVKLLLPPHLQQSPVPAGPAAQAAAQAAAAVAASGHTTGHSTPKLSARSSGGVSTPYELHQVPSVASISEGVTTPSTAAPAGPGGSVVEEPEADDASLDWVVWSAEDVGDWVDGLIGAGMGEPFRREDIDGPMLVRLTDSQLRDTLQIRDPMQRAKLLAHLRAFKERRERLARRAARRKGVAGQHSRHGGKLELSQPGTPSSARRQVLPSSEGSSMTSTAASGKYYSSASRRTPSGPRLASSNSKETLISTANFSTDSPVSKQRGSFTLAQRSQLARTGDSPGPCAYNARESELQCKAATPYKATVGNSPRRTTEYLTGDGDGPGPMTYDTGRALQLLGGRTSSPRPTIGNSPRKCLQLEEAAPGPCSYVADKLRLRPSSPRATVGKSPRKTACSPEASPGPASYDVDGLRVRPSSPRAVVGKSARKSLLTDEVVPGPCSYDSDTLRLRTSSPRPVLGNSPRDTTEFVLSRELAQNRRDATTRQRGSNSRGPSARSMVSGGCMSPSSAAGRRLGMKRVSSPERPLNVR